MLALVDQRAGRRHRTIDDANQGDPFLAKLHSARGNARHLEQDINEMCQLSHLALDDIDGLTEDWILDALQAIAVSVHAKEKGRVDNGVERVAQFMAA